LQVFLFCIYLLLFSSFFYVYRTEKNTGFSIQIIIGVFILKVLAGCLNLYIHEREYVSNDIRFYHLQALEDLSKLSTEPSFFWKQFLFNWGDITHHLNIFSTVDSVYWSDLGNSVHTKFMVLSDIFSMGNPFVNVIFFNVIYFFGQLLLYKTCYSIQPQKKILFFITIFMIPSVLFWCSGIHKDGWVLSAIGCIVYFTNACLKSKKLSTFFFFFCSLFFLLMSRYFYLLCLLPPLIIWISISYFKPIKKFTTFLLSYTCLLILLFSMKWITNSHIDLLQIIIHKQEGFFLLKGYSDMNTPALANNIQSFCKNFPSALDHILLQPVFKLGNPIKYIFAAVDTYLVLFFIVILGLHVQFKKSQDTLFYFLLFFSFSVYLFIGYTIPNCGALVRYKSEFTTLLLPALVGLSEVPIFDKLILSIATIGKRIKHT